MKKRRWVPSILTCGLQQSVYYKVWLSCSSVSTRWSLGMFVSQEANGIAWIGLEQNIIDTAVNERRKRLLACVRIVGQHFKQFYCSQLKNGQLDELLAKVSEMWTKCVFTRYVNYAIISHWIKSDISLVVLSPRSAKTNVGWGGKLNNHLMAWCVRNIRTKIYQNLIAENVGDAFLEHIVLREYCFISASHVYYHCVNAINCAGRNVSKSLLQARGEADANMYLCSIRPGENAFFITFQ